MLPYKKLLLMAQQRLLGLFWEAENGRKRLLQVQNQPFRGHLTPGGVSRLLWGRAAEGRRSPRPGGCSERPCEREASWSAPALLRFPAAPAKWTYRAIYRVNDAQVGLWSKPVSLTVQA